MDAPWVDKYRPLDFDKVVGNMKNVQLFRNLAADAMPIPNLLVCGPPGCGKTLCVDLLCENIIKENRENRILRSSSFDDRGVESVRTTIKNFAKGKVRTEANARLEKIVVLDEADSLAPDAFQALRGIMEAYSSTTRFIIVCNNSAKIIEPIQSRCAILRFLKVEDEHLRSKMSEICDKADVEYTEGGTWALARVADGDVRTAINSLSSTVSAFRAVTEENVYRTCDTPRPAMVMAIIELLRHKKDFARACRKLREVVDDGHAVTDVVSVFFKSLSFIRVAEEEQRLEIARVIGIAQSKVLGGSPTYLQLVAMLADISKILTPD